MWSVGLWFYLECTGRAGEELGDMEQCQQRGSMGTELPQTHTSFVHGAAARCSQLLSATGLLAQSNPEIELELGTSSFFLSSTRAAGAAECCAFTGAVPCCNTAGQHTALVEKSAFGD